MNRETILLQNRKDLYVSFMKDTADVGEQDNELNSLHHEFNLKASQDGQRRVRLLVNYIKTINNPFSLKGSTKLVNITTQEAVMNSDYLLNCIDFGNANYQQFVQERFVVKTSGFHATITTKYESSYAEVEALVTEKEKIKMMSDEADNSSAVNYLHYATSRGKTLEVMLQYPLTSRPVFLLEENSLNPKKSSKSDLTNILLQYLDKESIIVNDNPSLVPHVRSNAVVVDLMSVIRKLSAVELSNAKTFGSFCSVLLSVVVSYAKESDEIHLIMENYRHMSIKTVERIRRATKAGITDFGVCCEVLSEEQPLPTPFNDFLRGPVTKLACRTSL